MSRQYNRLLDFADRKYDPDRMIFRKPACGERKPLFVPQGNTTPRTAFTRDLQF